MAILKFLTVIFLYLINVFDNITIYYIYCYGRQEYILHIIYLKLKIRRKNLIVNKYNFSLSLKLIGN